MTADSNVTPYVTFKKKSQLNHNTFHKHLYDDNSLRYENSPILGQNSPCNDCIFAYNSEIS